MRRTTGFRLLLAWFGAAALAAAQAVEPVAYDFEADRPGALPAGWFVPTPGYRATVVEGGAAQGKRCLKLEPTGEGAGDRGPFGNVMRVLDAEHWRGKTVRLRAAVRVEARSAEGAARLWLRVDREGGGMGLFDNMGSRPALDRTWTYHEIAGDVDADARTLNFGLMLFGAERVWLDDFSLAVTGDAKLPEGPRPLTDRGLENLKAFTRLLGYVRHFHPSDAARAADWNALAIAAVPRVEAAPDAEELARALASVFIPVAAGVEVFPTAGEAPPLPEALLRPPGRVGVRIVHWEHHGFGQPEQAGIYHSAVRQRPFRGRIRRAGPGGMPDPAQPLVAPLAGGVTCRVPLALYQFRGKTVPEAAGGATGGPVPTSAQDRSVRLAAVALAWNVFQHFYPYFDVVDVDWPAALADALRAAATDPDEEAFLATLRRMVARLEDGHGYVGHRSDRAVARLPLAWAWIEDRLVVTRGTEAADPAAANAPAPRPGDAVLAIDGVAVNELRSRLEPRICAATPQHRRFRLAQELALFPPGARVRLDLERDGHRLRWTGRAEAGQPPVEEARPPKIHEVRRGIYYVDLGRVDTAEFAAALTKLAAARGLVFDLRGYPGNLSTIVLAHLIDRPIQSARWLVPVIVRPDRDGMTFLESGWPVQPQAPRLSGKVAFLTDGRAISYAETYLGMVEHYRLGAIVGEATAGTNGNVNPFELPEGYRIVWTGMKVLKHDGSRHHGVGIPPTVPVARTRQGVLEGRDELLDRAIEIVAGER